MVKRKDADLIRKRVENTFSDHIVVIRINYIFDGKFVPIQVIAPLFHLIVKTICKSF